MITDLVKYLNEHKDKFFEKDKDWTKCLKELLQEFGKERNLEIAANGIEDDNEGEYLYDVVLYEMHPDSKCYEIKSNIKVDTNHIRLMKSARMVIESEISQMTFGGLKVDFDKLFASNAEYKVFVTKKICENDLVFSEFLNYAQLAVNKIEGTNIVYVIYWMEWLKEKEDNVFGIKVIFKQ